METTVYNGNALSLNTAFTKKILTDFIRDETHHAGFSKAVVGLSGGVDSAVSAFLAAETLGKENVLAVMMPYKTSSPASKTDAESVVKALGIRSETADITSAADAVFAQQRIHDNVRKGNVMARVRMIMLYDYSIREKALVIGTSNKTETLLGYGTLFGDMACALNPLGDLYKTQVWELAESLGVPETIVKKKPTADLWVGQTDEDELGFSYKNVDRLLFAMVDERRSDEELKQLGFAKDFIVAVRKRVRHNQFKRRLPLVAKVSYRTVNVDFRYVRDWGI
ncbi:MAG: NAD+ synthase [Bacteroidota bacterium]|nr:NAD+ synthase [Bacteroidota bacterium]